MRSESEVPFADVPFTIPVADRMKRLPPYLFGKINKLKYQKRVAGIDVIDLGMGNPTDAPDPLIQQKLAQMAIQAWVSESIVYRTAGLIDRNLEGVGVNDPAAALARTSERLRALTGRFQVR